VHSSLSIFVLNLFESVLPSADFLPYLSLVQVTVRIMENADLTVNVVANNTWCITIDKRRNYLVQAEGKIIQSELGIKCPLVYLQV